MEFQTFINNTEHYIQELKKLNLHVKTHAKRVDATPEFR